MKKKDLQRIASKNPKVNLAMVESAERSSTELRAAGVGTPEYTLSNRGQTSRGGPPQSGVVSMNRR